MTLLGTIGSLALAAMLLNDVRLGSTGQGIIAHRVAAEYLVTGALLLAGALITRFGGEEVPLAALPTSQTRAAAAARPGGLWSWIGPWRSANFTWVLRTHSCVGMARSKSAATATRRTAITSRT